jgi:hypothetical protein
MQTKVIQKTKQDEVGFEMNNKTYYDHVITVDGIDYHYVSMKKDLTNFVAGKEATFNVEETTMKNGKTRMKISPVQEKPAFVKGGGFGKNNYSKDDAQISFLSCLSSAATFHQGRSTPNFQAVVEDALKAYEVVRSKRGDFN